MSSRSLQSLFLVLFIIVFFIIPSIHATQTHLPTVPDSLGTHHVFLHKVSELKAHAQKFQETQLHPSTLLVVAGILCFIASSISSAGGIGGGGIFVPILTIVAGLDLKTASSLSAFMVTGGSAANVLCSMCTKSPKYGGKTLIDYDIALLSEPCMLLGVSVGVICNRVFPEWLITILFAVFLAWSTAKTCRKGVMFWKKESEEITRKSNVGVGQVEENRMGQENNGDLTISEEPLLGRRHQENHDRLRLPWLKLGILLLIWFSFFTLHLLLGNKYGQSIIPMEPCGVVYWILSSVQIPLTVIFIYWIVSRKESHQDQPLTSQDQDLTGDGRPNKLIFPIMALSAGLLGGVFGIGGGMLISPLLLQVGMAPEVTAATCSFMVFFSSTMSASQYMLLGMEHTETALILAVICFVASMLGLLVLRKAVHKYGRASLIVFAIGMVMVLSIVLMTSFGAIQVWRDYKSGKYLGFKLPC
ncbi:sulfite exporter TauE/SafE family protein 2-like [Prosopis cineraria]|uniref:sulfite exporter TauE/SafE family protein 2-like n=1 Tax=Prosopis cineraria TaxID=364024 RepID=UPI00241024AB|nr:sulfite exporter TauE/SafE family protein 2-like [Prosopis cineraria]